MFDKRLKYSSPFELDFVDSMVPILYESGLYKEADRLSNCGKKYSRYRCINILKHDHNQFYDFAFPYRCEQRICPVCTRIRAKILRGEIEQILKSINKTKTNKFMHLTLTKNMFNVSNITPSKVRIFNENVRKLINLLYPKTKNCGALSILEFGKNLSIHSHIIIFGPYRSQRLISKKWKEITGDSHIVFIRSIQDQKIAINYLLKYISKPPKFSDPNLYPQFLKAIRGVRKVHRYGIFYNFKVKKREPMRCPICGGSIRFLSTVYETDHDFRTGFLREYDQVLEELGLNLKIERN